MHPWQLFWSFKKVKWTHFLASGFLNKALFSFVLFWLWPVPIYPGVDYLHYLHQSGINAKETLSKPLGTS